MPLTTDVGRLLAQAKYRYQDQTKRDITNALTHYRNLTPVTEKYVFPDGNQRDLICLNGTIPVSYRGSVYNIPVSLWITDSHPYAAPLCYVRPTPDMTIKVSRHVDASGRIFLPYLSDWSPQQSDLLGVIQVMIIVFGETPPVYAKPRVAPNVPATGPETNSNVNPPYPSTGFQPMPRIGNPPLPPTSSATGMPQPPYPQYPSQYPFSGGYPPSSGGQPPYPQPSSTNPFHTPNPYPQYPNPYQTATSQPPQTQSSQQSPVTGTGTITEEHIRASLLSAVEDKLKQRLREKVAQSQAEIDVLKKTGDDLVRGKSKLEEIVKRMENEMIEINDCKEQMITQNAHLNDLINKCDENGKTVDIDDAFGPHHVLYKQLLNAFAEENSIVDAIYYLGEALNKGVIDLEIFLKHVRELSRRQFMLRALMIVCRQKAGLPC